MSNGDKATTVYIVSWAPFNDRASVGGYNWFYSLDDAEINYTKEIEYNASTHTIRLLPFNVVGERYPADNDNIDNYILQMDEQLDDIELNIAPIRQHNPS